MLWLVSGMTNECLLGIVVTFTSGRIYECLDMVLVTSGEKSEVSFLSAYITAAKMKK